MTYSKNFNVVTGLQNLGQGKVRKVSNVELNRAIYYLKIWSSKKVVQNVYNHKKKTNIIKLINACMKINTYDDIILLPLVIAWANAYAA